MPDAASLCRKYLAKLTPSMRSTVMLREWKLDPGSEVTRRPATWEEVATAAGMKLSEAADIGAAGSHI